MKGKKFAVFLLIVFITSLLPYIIVAINLDYNNDNQLRSFYGDGSILTLCTGILLSYYSIFLDFKREKNNVDDSDKISYDNILITVVLFLIYAIVLVQFYLCQTTTRNWVMITKVLVGSLILLLLTLAVASYLHFREEVSFSDIQQYIDKRRMQNLDINSNNTSETEDGTIL